MLVRSVDECTGDTNRIISGDIFNVQLTSFEDVRLAPVTSMKELNAVTKIAEGFTSKSC